MQPAKILKYPSFLIAKIFLFGVILFLPQLVSAQTDKEFWFAAPYINDEGRDFDKPVTLRITTLSSPATIMISLPADPSFTPITKNIGANSTISVDLTPWITKIENSPANTVLNKGLQITSTADITAYYEVVSSFCNCDPEIFSLKGKNALGTDFFISSQYTYDESTSYNATNSFDIVASKNNTHVIITPSKNIIGHNANLPFTIILNAGQTYSAVATSSLAGGHLQGSSVTADNPIAITLKDDLMQVSSCADLVGDQTVPTNVLGTEYIVTKGFFQPNDNIYILAIADGTSVYVDGNTAPAAVLAKGGSLTLNLTNPSTYIRSDKNIYVYHFTGNGCEAGSAIIPKLNCTGSQSVSIVRSSSDLFAVLITTKDGNQGNFIVNGSNTLVKSSDFFPVPGTGGTYVTSRIDLSSTAPVGSALNFSNPTGKFSLGFINGGTNNGTRYGFFSDFKSSNVQNSSVEICPSSSAQLSAYGGVTYKWSPATGLSDPNIANPLASPATTTDYTVTITSADGCIDFANVHVAVLSSITPTVTIAASENNICAGTPVTFTAMPTNPGSTPTYQWQVNGINAGTNSPTFTSNTLVNGDKVTCTMTSSAICAAPAIVTSSSITMTVNPNLTASVSIAASQNNICAGTPVTFTATPVNGGTTPTYQWMVDGINVGPNSPTFTSSSFASGNNVMCVMTTNTPCTTPAVASSNVVVMSVTPNITPSVSIAASADDICTGDMVTFIATPVTGGATPAYQWILNGNHAGTNSPVFASSTLANGDAVSCIITITGTCITNPTATSNVISMTVGASVSPSVTIAASENNICAGTLVTFTATAVNGGNTPIYQWQINGDNTGTNSSTLVSSTLADNDVVTCILINNTKCATPSTAMSNNIIMAVYPLPLVNSGGDKTIDQGTSIQLNATVSGNIADITWSPATGLDNTKTLTPTASPTKTTSYTITVLSANNCTAKDIVKITVLSNISIPNTFTPNADGINDKWEIKNLIDYTDCSIKIFNRWGQEVYHSIGYPNAWDGTLNGKRLPFGTYYYVINLNNNTPPLSGYVVIIK